MTLNRQSVTVALMTAGMLAFNSCSLKQMVKMAKDQELTVTPSPLEVHGDSVAFDISASLPVKMLKKNKIYSVSSFYKIGDEKIELGSFDFVSTEYPDAKTTQPKITKHQAFAYKPEIGNGDLVVVGTASNLDKTKSKSTEELPVAKGLITTSRLVKDYTYVAYADHGYNNKEELIPSTVNFYFEQGKSVLRKSEMKGENAKFLDAFITAKNVTRTISVIGHHSPEGTETKNANLANERSVVIEKYVKERMKHFKQDSIVNAIQFVTKGDIKDFEPLKAEIAKDTKLAPEHKDELLSIINGSGDFTSKQQQIEKLPYYNKSVLAHLYPTLRTARTEIWTVKPKKTDAQISLLAGQIAAGKVSPDTLTAEELSYAGTLTPILSEKVAIYEALVKKTDNWAAYNNLGAAYVEQAKAEVDQNKKKELVNKAINTLEMSIKKQDSGEAHVNLASAYILTGVRDLSRTEANKAVASNASDAVKKGANGILGTLDVKDGKYELALQDLSKSNDSLQVKFNSALASLLKKDFNTAKAGFANYIAAAPNDAAGYYLAAVTAARQKDEATLTTNLKKAKALSAKYGERAVSDMEFYDYWNSENFKNALK
ncbi:OmpA family protein [Cytophaga aurantiaca]|uniref:OmpA family protein n=1 Tax=Cytophaga aurantiaca TaxID=29530 RepID=UPI0003687A2B|nr:OmpA family protein [Cytophaga aurantiaca]